MEPSMLKKYFLLQQDDDDDEMQLTQVCPNLVPTIRHDSKSIKYFKER